MLIVEFWFEHDFENLADIRLEHSHLPNGTSIEIAIRHSRVIAPTGIGLSQYDSDAQI